MNEIMTEQATETPTVAASVSDASAMEDMFRRELGIEAKPKDESGDKPDNALSEGLPKDAEKAPKAPDAETPAEKDVKPSEDAPINEVAKTDEKPTDESEDDDSMLKDFLEIEVDSAKSAEDWKARNSETRRYADELNNKIRSYEEALASAGRQLINTDDGLKLAPTEDAEEFKPETVANILKSLTEDEKELFTDEPEKAAKLIAERTIKAVADKFAPIQANAQEKRLTSDQLNEVYGSFLSAKMSDGKTARFPDAEDPKVVAMMQQAFDSTTNPAMERLKKEASKDKDMQHFLLEYLYYKTFRARHAQMTYKAEQKKAQEKLKKNNEKEPSLSAGGASAPVKGQTRSSSVSERIQGVFASEIAKMAS